MEHQEKKVCNQCGRELPIDEFNRNHYGHVSVCKECSRENGRRTRAGKSEVYELKRQLEEATKKRLEDFTPRQLMEDLKRRGYTFKATYTKVITIDSKDL